VSDPAPSGREATSPGFPAEAGSGFGGASGQRGRCPPGRRAVRRSATGPSVAAATSRRKVVAGSKARPAGGAAARRDGGRSGRSVRGRDWLDHRQPARFRTAARLEPQPRVCASCCRSRRPAVRRTCRLGSSTATQRMQRQGLQQRFQGGGMEARQCSPGSHSPALIPLPLPRKAACLPADRTTPKLDP